MSDVAIVFTLIAVALALFIWNKIPAVIVGIGVSLALFFTGILSANEALAGFGDPTVVLVAGLFVVSTGLEAAGVTTWAGQLLVEKSGASPTRAFIFVCLLAALATATVSVNGAVASLLPVVIVVALRLGVPTSQLLLPLCFATHSASMLTLLGAPLNVIAANMAKDAGYGGIGFFEFAIAGIPIFLGSVVVMLLTQRFLLPHRNGELLPADFSAHAQTLVEQYRLEDGLHRLRVRSTSPYVGKPRSEVDLSNCPGLDIVAIQESGGGKPLQRASIAVSDLLLVRGDKQAAGRLAADQHLAFCSEEGAVAETLFNKGSGLAEVVIPPRSELIGQAAFPGMSAATAISWCSRCSAVARTSRRSRFRSPPATTCCCRGHGRRSTSTSPIPRCLLSTCRRWCAGRPCRSGTRLGGDRHPGRADRPARHGLGAGRDRSGDLRRGHGAVSGAHAAAGLPRH